MARTARQVADLTVSPSRTAGRAVRARPAAPAEIGRAAARATGLSPQGPLPEVKPQGGIHERFPRPRARTALSRQPGIRPRRRGQATRRPHRQPADLLVIGLGYVGLPLAREAAFAGLTVVGYDLNTEVVAGLNAGRSHVGDVPAADIAEMLRRVSAPRRVKKRPEIPIPS